MSAEYSVDEVRRVASQIADDWTQEDVLHEIRQKASDICDAYAERIEADERAVPAKIVELDECRRRGWNDSAPAYRAGWNDCRVAMIDAARPPAQAAQVADAFRRGYDRAKLGESINAYLQAASAPTTEPVAQGEALSRHIKVCPRCDGRGRTTAHAVPCVQCNGTGESA